MTVDRHRLQHPLRAAAVLGTTVLCLCTGRSRNIGSVYRTINTPTVPLMFLEPAFQRRFAFERSDDRAPALGAWTATPDMQSRLYAAWVLRFREVGTPTVVRRFVGGGDIASVGRYWIEPSTGAVLATELVVADPTTRATIDVVYGSALLPGMLVPASMREQYVNMTDRAVTTGTATYGSVRRFGVSVDEDIATPKGRNGQASRP